MYPSVIASKFVYVCLNCIRSFFIRIRKLSLICKQNAFFIFHLIAFFAFLGGQPPSRVKDNCKTCTRKINAKENLKKINAKENLRKMDVKENVRNMNVKENVRTKNVKENVRKINVNENLRKMNSIQ